MGLPQLATFPILIEQEVRRIFIVLMQVVIDAAFFGPSDVDQFEKLSLHQVDLVGVGFDVGNDGQLGHWRRPLFDLCVRNLRSRPFGINGH